MHRRTPPPNGIQAEVAGAPSRKRSGRKRERLRIAVAARVREPDRRRDVGSGRQLVAVDAERRREPPPGQRDDRPEPQRLGDDGAQVRLLARVELGDEPLERLCVACEEVLLHPNQRLTTLGQGGGVGRGEGRGW